MSDTEVTPVEMTPAAAPEEAEPEKTESEMPGEEEEEELTVDLDNLSKMKVSELKDILKALDLPISGTKPLLIERIQEHFAEEDKNIEKEEPVAGEAEGEAEAKPAVDIAEESELLSATTAPSDTTTPSETPTVAPTAPTDDSITDEERKEQRKEKFGLLTDEDKKEKRAVKFGVDTEKSIEEKKKARAVKFAEGDENKTANIDKSETVPAAADKKAARAARFGITNTESAKPANGTAKTPVTAPSVDDEKLKKRSARFSLDSADNDAKPAKTAKLVDISTTLKDKVESGNTKVSLSPAGMTAAEKKKLRALKFGA